MLYVKKIFMNFTHIFNQNTIDILQASLLVDINLCNLIALIL